MGPSKNQEDTMIITEATYTVDVLPLRELYHVVGGEPIPGDCTDLLGDCSGLRGDCSGVWGDCSGLRGDCSGLWGD